MVIPLHLLMPLSFPIPLSIAQVRLFFVAAALLLQPFAVAL